MDGVFSCSHAQSNLACPALHGVTEWGFAFFALDLLTARSMEIVDRTKKRKKFFLYLSGGQAGTKIEIILETFGSFVPFLILFKMHL